MRRLSVLIFACCLLAPLFAADAPPLDDRAMDESMLPELKTPVAKEAPKIDGVLDDAAWKEAATSESFALKEGSKAKGRTKVYVTRDNNALYIAVECFDSEDALKKLKADAKAHDDDPIWGDDNVELFIDPSGKRENYYQVIINAKGVTWDAWLPSPLAPDKTWNPDFKSAVKVNKDNWTLEIALPFACFTQSPKSAAVWAFNVTRMRPNVELTYWSPVYNDGSHHPEKFGRLSGMPAVVLNGNGEAK